MDKRLKDKESIERYIEELRRKNQELQKELAPLKKKGHNNRDSSSDFTPDG